MGWPCRERSTAPNNAPACHLLFTQVTRDNSIDFGARELEEYANVVLNVVLKVRMCFGCLRGCMHAWVCWGE